MRGVFVTGTGTEVGKTVVAAVIARSLSAAGQSVAVLKPAVTGLEQILVAESKTGADSKSGAAADGLANRPDHEVLREAAGSRQSDAEIVPYRYQPPMSPHLAAELAGEAIEPARLLATARDAAAGADILVCEGVGGLLVPLSLVPPYLVRDFAVDLALPVVIAASPGLGTLNHTLLTIEAAREAGLAVAGVVLTPWPDRPSLIEESNRATIAALGGITVEALPLLDLAEAYNWPSAGDWRFLRAIRE